MYFYGVFTFEDHPVEVFKTDMTQAQLRKRLEETRSSVLNISARGENSGDCWIEYAPGYKFDAWEYSTNGKLYLCESMARGMGERVRKKWLQRRRLTEMADRSKSKRKKRQFNII